MAGIKKHYAKEDLLEKQVVIVNNLEPATIRGVESCGMILCASSGKELSIISPAKFMPAGSSIR